ncbi:MAG: membrane protein insertase YidC, partial [Alphaproteobacteria bacterium]|nr:membrane protein insertase YidC [Alphaproteobacteria bacterium]
GARLDDLTLATYRQSGRSDSGQIVLLSPQGTPIELQAGAGSLFAPRSEPLSVGPYYVEFGWSAGPEATLALPGPDAVWQADGTTLAPDRPLTLSWENGQGLRFTQRFEVDSDFMFRVTRTVENSAAAPVTLFPYGLVARAGTPATSGFYILHEGPVGVFDGTLEEHDYSDLQEAGRIEKTTTGGWLGIADKYWLVTLVPDQRQPFTGRFSHHVAEGQDRYQVDYLRGAVTVPAGGSVTVADHVFAGAKVVRTIDAYEDSLGIVRFDLAASFRWLYFLAKPLFHVLVFFYDLVGNFGVAILLLTVCVKILFFPLANKSYRAMAAMKRLQPEVVRLREQFGSDRQRLQRELMELYKREKANPMMGCLPILVQIPVFFALYEVLFTTIEMRQAPFFGWITDLSTPDPSNILNPFGLVPFEYPEFLHLGVWPVLMGLSMWLQMRLNPQPQDPIQQKIFLLMPIVFTFMLAPFPSGLIIYWTWNNLLSLAQQWVIMKRHGVAKPAKT